MRERVVALGRRSSGPGGGGCARRARRPPPRAGRRRAGRPVKARTQYGAVACGRMARLGLGLAALGRPGYLNVGHGARAGRRPLGRTPCARARTRCSTSPTRQGVRDFDAARSYGRAEEFLGEWLRSRNPTGRDDQLQVGLRLHRRLGGRRTTRRRSSTTTSTTFRRQLAETREHLGEWLALYQIHSATPDSGVLRQRRACCARCRRPTCRSASRVSGTSQAETIDAALSLGTLRRRAGDLEPARARGRGRAGAAAAAA